jgi:hypothetical protein
MEHWYRFLARGLQPIYGHGTLSQAFQFAGRLNRARDVIIYSTKMLTDEETQELGLEGVEAFSLTRTGKMPRLMTALTF